MLEFRTSRYQTKYDPGYHRALIAVIRPLHTQKKKTKTTDPVKYKIKTTLRTMKVIKIIVLATSREVVFVVKEKLVTLLLGVYNIL